MSTVNSSLSAEGDYAWELATLFPEQGFWSEEAYLDLTDGTNRRIELIDGRLEFLPMPTELHQALAGFLYHALLNFVTKRGLGIVPFPPLRVRIPRGHYREPDILFLRNENFQLRSNRIWNGADLVMEVVSPDPKDHQRDYEEKLADYAAAGISEYWIIDAERQVVVVYCLKDGRYNQHGEFRPGQQATSALLKDFAFDVTALFGVADSVAE
ncbi:MAG TPA: Uma2 family endonuclease [Lacipirellulaceae bacterium]|jgi:Uma2 family endonuclease